ncbi:MAG: 4'-phosphopantetheinyl transferase superfamily protein [Thermodesulfobacteriota bacterium]|nr:4'-phosphopantetheinyl transferase superfamily protein [Thermodesulfobacteriota bacterium]
METIYPVILAVPEKSRQLAGKDKVLSLSKHARQALAISAGKSCVHLSNLLKDKNGAPLPFNGNYWSLTHKPDYAGGVVAPTRIGIDIEKIRQCSEALFSKTAGEKEWSLVNTDPIKLFFRYWTSKESVLKAVGAGLKDLSKCIITKVVDEDNLFIAYKEKEWLVEHFYFDGHIASVTKNSFNIKWSLVME